MIERCTVDTTARDGIHVTAQRDFRIDRNWVRDPSNGNPGLYAGIHVARQGGTTLENVDGTGVGNAVVLSGATTPLGTIVVRPESINVIIDGGPAARDPGHRARRHADHRSRRAPCSGDWVMAKKISELPAAAAVANADELEINQSGTSRKATRSQIVAGLAAATHTHALADVTDAGALAAQDVIVLGDIAATGTPGAGKYLESSGGGLSWTIPAGGSLPG